MVAAKLLKVAVVGVALGAVGVGATAASADPGPAAAVVPARSPELTAGAQGLCTAAGAEQGVPTEPGQAPPSSGAGRILFRMAAAQGMTVAQFCAGQSPTTTSTTTTTTAAGGGGGAAT